MKQTTGKMKRLFVLVTLASLLVLVVVSTVAHADPGGDACWGQATAVFAQMGVMGEHASQQLTPRLGLRNLARALYDQGVIGDDTLEALGGFVAAELGLTIEACMD